ncbi:hypothetical protein M9H77_29866 [Catharanthus roseus]|uniref:Uncharacterized protein n=1 Tax=Catharanthus roseus TaxID=4058 RepID=A0ACB9ZXL2_CATRO|nr:hypothetical protein M9H77_29866 [Catharanthus roseus]
MVRPSSHRGDDDLGPVTDMTCRVQDCTVTTLSRGVRGRHSTSDLSYTSTPLPAGFHYDIGTPRSSTQPPPVHFLSRLPLPSLSSHTPVLYDAYRSAHPPSYPCPQCMIPTYILLLYKPLNEFSGLARKLGAEFFEPMVGAVPPDSSYSTHDYTATDYGVLSSEPFICTLRVIGVQTGPEGDPVDPELIPSYGGHVAGPIWRGQDRGLLKCRSLHGTYRVEPY